DGNWVWVCAVVAQQVAVEAPDFLTGANDGIESLKPQIVGISKATETWRGQPSLGYPSVPIFPGVLRFLLPTRVKPSGRCCSRISPKNGPKLRASANRLTATRRNVSPR